MTDLKTDEWVVGWVGGWTDSYLSFPCAVKDVDHSCGQLLLGPETEGGLQSVAEQQVVGADVLCKLLVLLHWQDDDALVPGFNAHGGHGGLTWNTRESCDWLQVRYTKVYKKHIRSTVYAPVVKYTLTIQLKEQCHFAVSKQREKGDIFFANPHSPVLQV